MRLAFRFRLIPFVVTVLLVVLGIALGNWQTRRAEEKLAIAARVAERSAAAPVVLDAAAVQAADRVESGLHPTNVRQLEYRRARVQGEFVAAWPVFLENRPYNGRAGFYLAMPFRIAGSDTHVLVLRGWLPRDPADIARLPSFATPSGTVEIEGVVVGSAGHVMQLGTPGKLAPGARVQNLAVDEVARASGLALLPFFVQQTGPDQPGETLVRDWPLPASGVDKHRGYAFQWYALAAMAALFFVITGFRSGRTHVA
ncbi:SURF1 family protein [Massilia sp. Se16.2.3]|uniref:SURF1 family protein n=1 Tax=Massilia sp. Se16.2.3 TaxID=2709303 RepID=UPI0016016E79|nr:SURF1 family protein [Massilia sp. Se16.2.3]QNA98887.1 SURF1 family protein [Massilia sp. Se16.2.3]